MARAKNASQNKAKDVKQDEFYTQSSDIEKELKHYKKHFRGKTVFCNCDDPKVSNFSKYFRLNFKELGLKRLITACYKNENPDSFSRGDSKRAVWYEYDGKDEAKHRFDGDGDFRSAESVDLLKQADIVVTNPPFSLFREYVSQLAEHGKKFLIVGSMNAITYKETFGLILDNKIWQGCTHPVNFVVPDHYEQREVRSWRDKDGTNWRSLGNACWFTNLDIAKRHEDIDLYKPYTPKEYPKYDNYDAIEVGKVAEIPVDYKGVMGVPITFLDKYNPEQFELLGSNRGVDQDPNGVYGRGSMLNGKETFKRLFIKKVRA